MQISSKDRAILRDMAARQMELAQSEAMKKLFHEWELSGGFCEDSRPMVRIELWTFEKDIIPQLMKCEGADARAIERMMHANVVNHTLFGDDTLVRDHIAVPVATSFTPFGLPVKRQETSVENGGGLGHHFISQIKELEADFEKLQPSTFTIDREASQRRIDELNELFGDIIPVRYENSALGCSMMQDIVHIMDMEDMYIAMYDEPELFHKALDMLAQDYNRFFDQLAYQNLLTPTAKDEHLCQGTYCFTYDLPNEGTGLKLNQQWLYMDSQETAGVSPEMFREFVVPHYLTVSERFGLLSYGCCEAVHELWDDGITKFANLRKVSISPWCDEQLMGDRLRGTSIVFLRKPTPNLLGVGSVLDEDAVREHIKATAIASRGCQLEIAQRDVYEINNTPDKVRRYVELIRETVDTYWQP